MVMKTGLFARALILTSGWRGVLRRGVA